MLSTLPKLADKAFILGFFLPGILFVASLSALFLDFPWVNDAFTIASNTKDLAKLAFLILGVWVLAILMLLVNRLQYQVLEGYYWPLSHMKWLKARQVRSFEALKSRVDTLRAQRTASPLKFSAQQEDELETLGYQLRKAFPSDKQSLLPTRFGNAIRAFEEYSNNVYGADSVTLWPHMVSVVPKEFSSAVEDARSQVNCLINITYFSVVVGLVAVSRLLWNFGLSVDVSNIEVQLDKFLVTTNLYFTIAAVIAAFLTWLSYVLAIDRAYAWGDLVKAAFDCYLPLLAKQLGYALPETADDRYNFWIAVCQMINYHRPLKPEQWPQILPADVRVSKEKADKADSNAEKDEESGAGDRGEEFAEEAEVM
jgi:hypothetical protein